MLVKGRNQREKLGANGKVEVILDSQEKADPRKIWYEAQSGS